MSGGAFDYFYLQVENIANRIEFSTSTERKAFRKLLLQVSAALRAIECNESGDGDNRESYLIRACLAKTDVLYAAIKEADEMLVTLAEEVVRAKSMQDDGSRALYRVSPELAGQSCTVKYRIPAQGSQSQRACIRLDNGTGDIFVSEHCLSPIGDTESRTGP